MIMPIKLEQQKQWLNQHLPFQNTNPLMIKSTKANNAMLGYIKTLLYVYIHIQFNAEYCRE